LPFHTSQWQYAAIGNEGINRVDSLATTTKSISCLQHKKMIRVWAGLHVTSFAMVNIPTVVAGTVGILGGALVGFYIQVFLNVQFDKFSRLIVSSFSLILGPLSRSQKCWSHIEPNETFG
jgi:hypothetical protein